MRRGTGIARQPIG